MSVRTLKADGVLFIVAVLWGGTFPFIRDAMQSTDPYWFVGIRCLLAALVLVPFVWPLLKQTDRQVLIGGAILGALNAAIYIFQTLGLRTISSGTSAFITGMSVVFVPFLLPL